MRATRRHSPSPGRAEGSRSAATRQPASPRAQPIAAFALSLVVCRPTDRGPAPPPPPETTPHDAPAATPTAAPPGPTSANTCDDPTITLAGFAWLPAEARAFLSVHLHDKRLAVSLAALVHSTPSRVFPTDFNADLTDLRALLRTAKLDPPEAVHFRAGDEVGVWAVPGSCEPDGFGRVAAALGFEVRVAPGPTPVTFATSPTPGRFALVHHPGGPLWITGADQVGPLLTWIYGLSGESWADCASVLPLVHPDATLRIFQRTDEGGFRQHSITETRIVTTGHTSCSTP